MPFAPGDAAVSRATIAAAPAGGASGASEVFTSGRHEGGIAHFHRELDAALASGARE
jgi:hypothetical protein